MRSLLLPVISLASLALAAPPTSPTITRLVFSGSGCPNDSGSVRSDTATLSDNAGVSFTQLKGDSTDNCAVHIQSSGASAGWQVAVREIDYIGDVNLRGNSELDTFTQVFWSENAGNTVCFLLFYSFSFSLDCILYPGQRTEADKQHRAYSQAV